MEYTGYKFDMWLQLVTLVMEFTMPKFDMLLQFVTY